MLNPHSVYKALFFMGKTTSPKQLMKRIRATLFLIISSHIDTLFSMR